MFQHRGVIVRIVEGHVFIGDSALDIGERLCVRLVLDLDLCAHHIQVAAEAGEAFLHHFHQLYQDLDGTDKDADIEGVHGQIHHVHPALGDEIAAVDQGHQVHHALEEKIPSGEIAHTFVVGVLGAEEALIAPGEFLPFNVLVGEGLYHPDAGQGVLEAGVHISDLATVVQKVACIRLFWLMEKISMQITRASSGMASCQLIRNRKIKDPTILIREMNRFSGP